MSQSKTELFSALPSVAKFIALAPAKALCQEFGEGLCKLELRILLDELRQDILGRVKDGPAQRSSNSLDSGPTTEQLVATLRVRLQRYTAKGRDAINATGVILHTGLGRAPLPESCLSALAASRYSILQVELDSGGRSLREARIERLLISLTGCQAATVVNNNAAATFIILNTMSPGQEVIISRGQLIEIGGAFRMPDVMARSATILREVGTTNRTHVADYEAAINRETAAILFVDPSNYHIQGFAGTPSLEQLCELGKKHDIPVIADLGSGAILRLDPYGISKVTTIGDALNLGSVVTCSSGDKLIGGPQAGIICGEKGIVEKIRKNPFARMFRLDKYTLSALESTLLHYVNGVTEKNIPLYQMLATSIEDLRVRAEKLSQSLSAIADIQCSIAEDDAFIGGGSLPDQAVDSIVVAVNHRDENKRNQFAARVSKRLRLEMPSVFVRVKDEAVLFDMRTLRDGDLDTLLFMVPQVLQSELASYV